MIKKKMLGSLDFYKTAFSLSIPIIIQLLLQNFISLVDNFMVSGLGDIKTSGVNITNQLLFVFMVLVDTIAIGSGIFMSQYNGSKDKKGMKNVFRFKFTFLLSLTLVAFIIVKLFSKGLLSLLINGNADSLEILYHANTYINLIIYTAFFMAISYSISSALREIGNVKPSLVIGIIAALTNTSLNYILIYGKFGLPRLEVKGAAYATIIARALESILFVIYYYAKKQKFFVKLRTIFKIDLKLAKNILKKSLFIIIANVSWVITETIISALYNSRGSSDVVSGMSAGWSVGNLFFIIFPAVNVSISVLIGKDLGANKLEEAKKKAYWISIGSFILGIFVSIIMFLTSKPLVSLVFKHLSISSQNYATQLLYVIAFYLPIWLLINSKIDITRSGGDTLTGVYIDSFINFLVLVPAMFALTYFTKLSPPIMFAIVKTTDAIKYVIARVRVKKGYWIKNLTRD